MFKYFMALVIASISLSSPGLARYVGPLLVKEANSGFVPITFSRSDRCAIYPDRIVITHRIGAGMQVISSETKRHRLSGNVQQLLQRASQAPLKTERGPVDGPSVKYHGYVIQANDAVNLVKLEEENGGTGSKLTNTSEAAATLKYALDVLCPNTITGISGWNFE